SNEGDYAAAIEGTPDIANASSSPSPSSAPPSPMFCAEIRDFWPTCEVEPALRDLIAKRGETQARAIIRHVKKQRCDNPPGLARTLLEQGFVPPGLTPTTLPTHIPKPAFDPHLDTTDGDTPAADSEDTPTEPDADSPEVQ